MKCDEEASTTILSDSETKKVSLRNFKNSESANNSFEFNQTAKMTSSDDDTSPHDSCASIHTLGNDKSLILDTTKQHYNIILNTRENKMKASRVASNKTLNEASLSKVNWLTGFEEASTKQLFDCLWLRTGKVHEIVKRKYSETVHRNTLKRIRDQELESMLCDKDVSEEVYNKSVSNQITTMVSGILKNAGVICNPIQSMVARNIRHFENVRKQLLEPVVAKKTEQLTNECKCEIAHENKEN